MRNIRLANNVVITLCLAVMCSFQGLAQDRLYFLDGAEKDVKITEITTDYVKYKELKDLKGPTLITLKVNLMKIRYDNGIEEVVEHNASAEIEEANLQAHVENSYPLELGLDEWGRNETENRKLASKRRVQSTVVLGVGALTVATGAALWAYSVRDGAPTAPPSEYFQRNQSTPTLGLGIILVAGGTAMLISGVGLLRASIRYRKRAYRLANGTASISPVILNDTQFNGLRINSNLGFGIGLTCSF